MTTMEKQLKLRPIRSFNDHINCKGHANSVLQCTYETQEERDLLSKILGNYIDE